MSNTQKNKKHTAKLFTSIRLQMALTFIALMSFCILASILVASFFMGKVYNQMKLGKLEQDFNIINELIGEGENSDSALLPVNNGTLYAYNDNNYAVKNTICDAANISEEEKGPVDRGSYWLDTEKVITLDRLSVTDNLKIVLLDPAIDGRYAYSTETSKQQMERILDSLKGYLNNDYKGKNIELIVSNDSYKIYRADDNYIGSVNYDLIGVLDNGIFCFIRMNYESIENTVAVVNNFYGYVGLFMIMLEAIIILVISRKFIMPLENMNNVAKRMTKLDFEAKAEVNSSNEIGELAQSLNIMSENLEKTIIELKQANSELQVDLKKREEIDEMRKDFLGNVSHELKTPIAIIQGYAEGLKDNINDDEESRNFYCDVIIDEAVKMNEMVKKLLSLNKIEYGESQLELERFDVTELIKGILTASEVLAGERDIKVKFENKGPCFVFADEYMIEESITNFVSNAYHHVCGDNEIYVRLTDKEDHVRVSVFNTGNNIPAEDLDKIWDKFYKVDKARTREYGGSGIGLSIVKAVMELHHRKCGVINHKDGVEFWLELDSSPVNN